MENLKHFSSMKYVPDTLKLVGFLQNKNFFYLIQLRSIAIPEEEKSLLNVISMFSSV
jgi:hypothetical protein